MNKTIYMTYKKNIPEKVINNWIKHNDKYKINFSLDKDCLEFIKNYFNNYVYNLFETIKIGMYKADLWRLCKLYIYSGVYSDVDIVPYLDIDKLDKNIAFYSCISMDDKSIFQALIINFSNPYHPLFLVFLLSFLINKPYKYHNGPTIDMYNCIKYILNIDIIKSEHKYITEVLKLKVNIGTSNQNTKIINLHYFPENILYTVKLHKINDKELFKFEIKDNNLIVKRLDSDNGWKHNYFVDICFNYKTTFFFFKEIKGPKKGPYKGWITSYVTFNNRKILDSRDIEYYKNKGW